MDNTTVTVSGTCTGTTDKALFFRSERGNTATFPKSQIEVIEGEPTKGAHVTLSVPSWLIDRARTPAPAQPDISHTDKVLVTGTLLDRSEKALQIRRDADMVACWLAVSRIDI